MTKNSTAETGRRRWRAAVVGVTALLLCGLTPSAHAIPDTVDTVAAGHQQIRPGKVIRAEVLPGHLWLPNTAKAYRVHYVSTGVAGRPTVVSGAVFVPQGTPPKRGWPVVSWAHGTLGIADVCANSTAGRSQRDIDYLSGWLAAGYAVAATDYEGLGTPGPHPYLIGRSEAYGVIDIVRAARAIDRTLSRTWLAVGQSQGAQAVLFAGPVTHRYAPELDFRGSIATAPPSQFRTTAAVARIFDPAAPANPLVLLILAGLRTAHPHTFAPADYLTPYGEELLADALTSACFPALAARTAGKTGGDVYDIDAAEQENVLELIDTDAEIPIARHRRPVFIAQGTADTVVYPPASRTTADLLRGAGTDVTFRFYPGADHNGVMPAARTDLLAWAADRIR